MRERCSRGLIRVRTLRTVLTWVEDLRSFPLPRLPHSKNSMHHSIPSSTVHISVTFQHTVYCTLSAKNVEFAISLRLAYSAIVCRKRHGTHAAYVVTLARLSAGLSSLEPRAWNIR